MKNEQDTYNGTVPNQCASKHKDDNSNRVKRFEAENHIMFHFCDCVPGALGRVGSSTAVVRNVLTSAQQPRCTATMCHAHGLDKTTKTMTRVCNHYKLQKAGETDVIFLPTPAMMKNYIRQRLFGLDKTTNHRPDWQCMNYFPDDGG